MQDFSSCCHWTLNLGEHTTSFSLAGRILFGWWLLFIEHCLYLNNHFPSLSFSQQIQLWTCCLKYLWNLNTRRHSWWFHVCFSTLVQEKKAVNSPLPSEDSGDIGIGCFTQLTLLPVMRWQIGNEICHWGLGVQRTRCWTCTEVEQELMSSGVRWLFAQLGAGGICVVKSHCSILSKYSISVCVGRPPAATYSTG